MTGDSEQVGGNPQSVIDAREDWKNSTVALKQAQQVVKQTITPRTATKVADKALVSEPAARNHHKSLVEVEIAATFEEAAATKYARNEDTVLYRRMRDLAALTSSE